MIETIFVDGGPESPHRGIGITRTEPRILDDRNRAQHVAESIDEIRLKFHCLHAALVRVGGFEGDDEPSPFVLEERTAGDAIPTHLQTRRRCELRVRRLMRDAIRPRRFAKSRDGDGGKKHANGEPAHSVRTGGSGHIHALRYVAASARPFAKWASVLPAARPADGFVSASPDKSEKIGTTPNPARLDFAGCRAKPRHTQAGGCGRRCTGRNRGRSFEWRL